MRRVAITDRRGRILRDAEIEVEQAPDPRAPNQLIRRGRALDPLVAMHRAGSLSKRELEAAELLRFRLETAQASIPVGGGQPEVRVAPHLRTPIGDRQVDAAAAVRRACAALDPSSWDAVLWMAFGGSVRGYASRLRIRYVTASDQVRRGMADLADHYFGPERR